MIASPFQGRSVTTGRGEFSPITPRRIGKMQGLGRREHPNLDVPNGGHLHSGCLPVETEQGHHHAAGGATGAGRTAKDPVERLVEVVFHVLPCRLGGAMGELTMTQSVNDSHQHAGSPWLNDKGVAVGGLRTYAAGLQRRIQGGIASWCWGSCDATCGKRPWCPRRAWTRCRIRPSAG